MRPRPAECVSDRLSAAEFVSRCELLCLRLALELEYSVGSKRSPTALRGAATASPTLVGHVQSASCDISAAAWREHLCDRPSQLIAWRRDARAERHNRSRHSSCKGVVASVAGAVIEIAIGEVVMRVGVDVDEAHLRRVIRAVRSA